MAVTINASTSAGLIQSADTSGALQLQTNGTTVASTATNGDFAFNSGYGSAATAYGCRAWVNFNGTGTVAIRASGNVTSITDNGVGDYTVNFTTAMPDANYAWGYSIQYQRSTVTTESIYVTTKNGPASQSTTALRMTSVIYTAAPYDCEVLTAYIFR